MEIDLRTDAVRKLETTVEVKSLLTGVVYTMNEQARLKNGKPIGIIRQRSYPGLSGTGFIDKKRRLFLLSGGPDDEETTLIVPAWR
jgi:hypothetical protein